MDSLFPIRAIELFARDVCINYSSANQASYLSQFVGVEGFVTAITDMFPKFMSRKWYREIFTGITCIFMFFIGLSMVTNVS